MHPILIVALLAIAQANPAVTVTTDRIWYAPGDQVQVTVHGEWASLTGMFWVYVDGPDGRNVYFSNLNATFTSAFDFVFTLASDALEGNYTVTVTWDHEYAQTAFTVYGQPIPEFPIAPMVFLVATAVTALAISRWQTGARTQALAPHP